MATTTRDAFEESLAALDIEWTAVAATDFANAVAGVIEAPAVGAMLPFDGLSFDETDVTVDPSPQELTEAQTGVTAGVLGIADYGTVVVESTPQGTEPVSLFCEKHVAVLRESDIVPDMSAAFDRLGEKIVSERASMILTTGPSATADMGALVRGAHGPKTVHVIVVMDR